nr:TetR/AcrR family transcriptional regulator [Dysosmobacter acutus]
MATRKRIFDVAIELINERGFYQTTIGDIAEKAEISVGCFYEYFDNKEALLAEYLSAIDSRYQQYYQDVLSTAPFPDSMEKIRQYMHFSLQLLTNRSRYKDLLRVYYAYLSCNSDQLADRSRHFFTVLSKLIDQAISDGSIRKDLSKEFVVNLIVYLFRSVTIEWCSSSDHVCVDDYIPSIDEMIRFLRSR